MDTLETLVQEIELENKREEASDPAVKKMLGIVEEFLKHHRVMCYGGTAINNLLPKSEQFYDSSTEIPDYDFFSETPQQHAMMIADQLVKLNLPNIEVKPGMHLGTFKVFADFHGIADITHMDKPIFEKLWKENVVHGGIHYVTPNFLRMSMYLELSRPKGDVSRWKKVYTRLQLLNKHHPMTCPGNFPLPKDLEENKKREVIRMLKHHDVILMGFSAASQHAEKTVWVTPVVLLADKETIDMLTKGKKVTVKEGIEMLPTRQDVVEHGGVTMSFYGTQACHSYHMTRDRIKVASIPTLLQFFFAYLYTDAHADEVSRILCVADRLVELASHEGSRTFPLLTPRECLGHQETLIEMKKHRSEVFKQVSKDRSSPDFMKSFFSYVPPISQTEKNKLTKRVHKL